MFEFASSHFQAFWGQASSSCLDRWAFRLEVVCDTMLDFAITSLGAQQGRKLKEDSLELVCRFLR